MFFFFLAERLGKTIGELQAQITHSELLRWQIYFHQEHWKNRITQETPEGRSAAIKKLILGKHG